MTVSVSDSDRDRVLHLTELGGLRGGADNRHWH